jgi:hypothetical protein
LKGVSHSMAMYYGYVAGQNAVDGIWGRRDKRTQTAE